MPTNSARSTEGHGRPHQCHHGQEFWVVTAYRCNYSAFSGYRRTPSAYSEVKCTECGTYWRTKAKYVERLPRDA